jgi:bacteriocin resistance YdeI/OmpD-like protein/uncharacterized protein DUF1905
MGMKHTFTATLHEGGIEVPLDVKALFGEARAPVQMTFCGETHKNRVAVYGGKYILGIWKAVLEKHGLADGSMIEVTLEHDDAPRVIEPPADLAAAMADNAKAADGWAAMSYTHQREWAQALEDAKKPETRTKRLAQAIEALVAKADANAGNGTPATTAAKSKPAAKAKAKPAAKARTKKPAAKAKAKAAAKAKAKKPAAKSKPTARQRTAAKSTGRR